MVYHTFFLKDSQVIKKAGSAHAVVVDKLVQVNSDVAHAKPVNVRVVGVQQNGKNFVTAEMQVLTQTALASF